MNLIVSRLRSHAYRLGRALFRAMPMSDGRRDRLRTALQSHLKEWIPKPQTGRASAAQGAAAQLRLRADEPSLGHIAYRKGTLPASMPATLVAFYLPQFHTFAENDQWWGKGFTEWRNVTRALPQFEGHVQPRLPADLGFYDLRNPQVMRDQAQLAAEYGIGAFCFYFYWFSGQTLMETPLQQWLTDESIDLPFCLCWANENWARRWDGRDEDILIAQQHSTEDDLAFIAHIAPYLRDRRALKVNGKPMLLVYRPNLLPDPKATAARWRKWCHDNGIGEIHLAYVQGFERPDPADIGFDAAVEFPPNISNPRDIGGQQLLLNPGFAGDVRDWRELAHDMGARPLPSYTLYPGVNPGWDNEARRSGKGRIYLHASPRGYRDWLANTIHKRLKGVAPEQRLVFINAWNEWAEGAILEPDARLGHAWLENTRQALQPPQDQASIRRPCIVIHATTTHALIRVLTMLPDTGLQWRILVITTPEALPQISRAAEVTTPGIQINTAPQHSDAFLHFMEVAEKLLDDGEQIVLRLLTDPCPEPASEVEQQERLQGLLSAPSAPLILDAFRSTPKLGIVTPEGGIHNLEKQTEHCEQRLQSLLVRLGLPVPSMTAVRYIPGGMFWVRLQALRPILDAHLPRSAFEADTELMDGNRLSYVERVILIASGYAGYQQLNNAQVQAAAAKHRCDKETRTGN